ncbi:magnesium/cobalt transporter CorA [Chitinimonas sp. PSY-7]|uniref:magnesium/cobalt transporter CorA n=1 Tax=Chitinimonas sp. PSY-7 TaxID=3459088 RepID=UPI004040241D
MLINCSAYQDGEKIGDLPVEDISEYACRADTFVWVAIKDPLPEEIDEMQVEFDLHPLAVEDARHGHQRPKIEEYGETLFCVLHMLEMSDAGELTVGEVDIFVGPNFILSIRNQAGMGFQSVRQRCEDEPELLRHGSGFVLYALIDTVVDRYFAITHRLESELEAIEERMFTHSESSTQSREGIEALYALKRKLVTVYHAAVPLLEAISHLHSGRVPAVCASMREYFRDVYDHLERIVKGTDTVRDMIATAIQVHLALIQLNEAAVSKQLAAWAALFAVPTMIAGVYGMNFEHMPELKIPGAYPTTLAVMVVLDLLLFWRFRKTGWL